MGDVLFGREIYHSARLHHSCSCFAKRNGIISGAMDTSKMSSVDDNVQTDESRFLGTHKVHLSPLALISAVSPIVIEPQPESMEEIVRDARV